MSKRAVEASSATFGISKKTDFRRLFYIIPITCHLLFLLKVDFSHPYDIIFLINNLHNKVAADIERMLQKTDKTAEKHLRLFYEATEGKVWGE